MNKKGNIALYIIIILVVLLIASTQKISINEKQVKVATPTTCNLIGKGYDPITHICIKVQNVSQTTP